MHDQLLNAISEEAIDEGEEEGIHPIPFPRFLEIFKPWQEGEL